MIVCYTLKTVLHSLCNAEYFIIIYMCIFIFIKFCTFSIEGKFIKWTDFINVPLQTSYNTVVLHHYAYYVYINSMRNDCAACTYIQGYRLAMYHVQMHGYQQQHQQPQAAYSAVRLFHITPVVSHSAGCFT